MAFDSIIYVLSFVTVGLGIEIVLRLEFQECEMGRIHELRP
jgi:hypothetical protein